MEKTKKSIKLIITIVLLVSGIIIIVFFSNTNVEVNDDCAMIDYAEFCMRKFNDLHLHQVIARSNYYYCTLNNKTTSYIVSNNFNYIRIKEMDNDTLTTIFRDNMIVQPNGDSMIILLHIVQNLKQHNISMVEVKGDTINLSKFDGYYLTNNCMSNKNNLRQIKGNWYVSE